MKKLVSITVAISCVLIALIYIVLHQNALSDYDPDTYAIVVDDEGLKLSTVAAYIRYIQAKNGEQIEGLSGETEETQDAMGRSQVQVLRDWAVNDLTQCLLARQFMDTYGVVLTEEESETISGKADEYTDYIGKQTLARDGSGDEDVMMFATLLFVRDRVKSAVIADTGGEEAYEKVISSWKTTETVYVDWDAVDTIDLDHS